MAEKIYVNGIRFFPTKQNQPDFVIGSGVITLNQLVKFFEENKQLLTEYQGEEQIKFQVLKGDKGPYMTVDTYTPAAKQGERF